MTSVPQVVVCGSFSFDTILRFPERFRDHLAPDRPRGLDVALHISELRQEYGGCAANICYNLHLLGCTAIPVATVGDDFDAYRARLDQLGIATASIVSIPGTRTARDHLIADSDDNQIAAFYPGAMERAHENPIGDMGAATLGIIAPDGCEGMRRHAREFADAGIPFVFDPGQVTELFGRQDLVRFVEQARWAIFNAREWQTFRDKSGLDDRELRRALEGYVVTRGAGGSRLCAFGETIEIPAARVHAVGDPTGCGDAYRAGLVFGLAHGLGWQTTGRLASTMGSFCYETMGAQKHAPSRAACYERHRENYGDDSTLESLLVGPSRRGEGASG